ncbi:FadR family transcriptional regulator [Pseudomonas stutzeri]|uniref:FadR/GntR family transcriptional regulator n=1 Tax=Stutzerimonas stutzeri TaxID=316 RepID=UPI0021096C7D|nr:FadR/GntR family transcriptional regulator [Stutzerimonas stutzeri]MCQ4310373.1 FadR family transcriptional regulator [Stutzerimonas stutzeri]
MQPINRAVPEYAFASIRQLIEDDAYQPGDALPSQRELAERFGVSRASLREALSSLSALGLVRIQPGKGVFVQDQPDLAADAEQAQGWPFATQVSAADTFQLRFALEGFASSLAALMLSRDELDALSDNVEAMRLELRAQAFEPAAQLDFDFHRRILRAAGNQAIVDILTSRSDIYLESQKLPFIRPERAMETWQEHRRILRALSRHTPSTAQKAMQAHIRAAASRTGISFAGPAA